MLSLYSPCPKTHQTEGEQAQCRGEIWCKGMDSRAAEITPEVLRTGWTGGGRPLQPSFLNSFLFHQCHT